MVGITSFLNKRLLNKSTDIVRKYKTYTVNDTKAAFIGKIRTDELKHIKHIHVLNWVSVSGARRYLLMRGNCISIQAQKDS
jgi:hypothetical protein